MLEYSELLGRKFVYGERDCLTLIQDFYRINFNITAPNYARPIEFWNHGLDLYPRLIWKNGFRPLDCHPSEYLPGDLLLMAINSRVANHASVLVENSHLLHHMYGNLSTCEPYTGPWRNRTLGIYRHPQVRYKRTPEKVNLMNILPSNKRQELDFAPRT